VFIQTRVKGGELEGLKGMGIVDETKMNVRHLVKLDSANLPKLCLQMQFASFVLL
jgi:hypothetical protein